MRKPRSFVATSWGPGRSNHGSQTRRRSQPAAGGHQRGPENLRREPRATGRGGGSGRLASPGWRRSRNDRPVGRAALTPPKRRGSPERASSGTCETVGLRAEALAVLSPPPPSPPPARAGLVDGEVRRGRGSDLEGLGAFGPQ